MSARPIFTSRHKNVVGVDGNRVDDSLVARKVLEEVSIGKLPNLDVVRSSRSKTESVCVGGKGGESNCDESVSN